MGSFIQLKAILIQIIKQVVSLDNWLIMTKLRLGCYQLKCDFTLNVWVAQLYLHIFIRTTPMSTFKYLQGAIVNILHIQGVQEWRNLCVGNVIFCPMTPILYLTCMPSLQPMSLVTNLTKQDITANPDSKDNLSIGLYIPYDIL